MFSTQRWLRRLVGAWSIVLAMVVTSEAAEPTTVTDPSTRQVKQVIVFVLSGVDEHSMRQTYTPTSLELAKTGVALERAIGVYPPRNPQALASLVTGASPRQTGLTMPLGKMRSESIFQVWQQQGLKTLLVASRTEDVTPLLDGFTQKVLSPEVSAVALTDQALEQWKAAEPFATFVVYSGPLEKAAQSGPGSEPYRKAITEADQQIARWITLIKDMGKWDDTLIVITADHGIASGTAKQDRAAMEREWMLPLIFHGPRLKTGVTLPPGKLLDVVPTLAHLTGQRKPAFAEGDILWNALLPTASQTQEMLYALRLADVSRQNLELSRNAYQLAEDKMTIDAQLGDVQEQKRQVQIFTEEKEQVIQGLEQKVRWQRYLIVALVGVATIGYVIEYIVLRKRFMMFD
ncbi:alkaline phosphatase family protein [Heliophilum fasciatum]|uniref:Sulfatase-like protein n=1 Tax=Heliophilum fasciatum TaxID=35700 RepID=A0A4R2RMP1_9FIRM|nr:alkaline phosphatase family protein [Heliophilum fasciatum]MCW2279162.1 hypothetical protein [Heliophilum fasciatum]TCP61021.1 sulfatase-like protein [Heliophilum fasciatum]